MCPCLFVAIFFFPVDEAGDKRVRQEKYFDVAGNGRLPIGLNGPKQRGLEDQGPRYYERMRI